MFSLDTVQSYDFLIILVVITVLWLSLLVWTAALTSKLGKLKTRLNQMLGGAGVADLEQVLRNLHQRVDNLEAGHKDNAGQIAAILDRLRVAKTNVAMKRYNGFGEHGNDLSFSLAIVDDLQTGLVLTGIHSREQTFVYAKPVVKGESQYALTPEEIQMIQEAANRKQS
ncbi:MAG TPA: DUF4446 family protein [Bacilli bacterium]